MIKLIIITSFFIIAITIPHLPFASIIKIDTIAWYAALLSLYSFWERYVKRHKEIEKSIYVTPLIGLISEIDELHNELMIISKMTVNNGLDKLEESLSKLQEKSTKIFGEISTQLIKADKHCKTNYKNQFENHFENKIFPFFSHSLQYLKQDKYSKEIFNRAITSLQENILEAENLLTKTINEISDKC